MTRVSQPKARARKYLRRLLLLLLCAALVLGLWQYAEYRKLQGLILPQDAPYRTPEGFPAFVSEAILENRRPYLEQSSQEQRDAFRRSISLTGYDSEADGRLAEQVLESWQSDRQRPATITLAELEEDLEYCHTYLQYASAHYSYYGGVEVFEPLFDSILDELTESARDGVVQVQDVSTLLRQRLLWVVRDLHAHIDGANYEDIYPEQQYASYWTEELIFDEDMATVYDGQPYTLRAVNGKPAETYLRPTILESGAFARVLWDYTPDYGGVDSAGYTLLLEDTGGNSVEVDVTLTRTPPYDLEEVIPYRLTEEEYYYSIVNSTLMPGHEAAYKQMEREAPLVRGGKPIVMDLRGHRGGWDLHGLKWIMKYIGVSKVQFLSLPIPTYSFDLQTRTARSMSKGKPVSGDKPVLSERYSGSGTALHIANDTPIYVLADRVCGSSGEWFLSYLRRMDNVVLVGEPTHGMLIGGNTGTSWLPNSRVKVTFSMSIGADSDLEDHEYRGYTPDLYVPAALAQERTAAMLALYGA